MCQDSQVVCLIMCVISSVVIGRFTNKDIPQFRYFYAGLLVMGVSFSASVAEGIAWPNGLNFIEHLCSAVSGLLFAIACFNLYRSQAAVKSEVADPSPCQTVETADLVWVKNR